MALLLPLIILSAVLTTFVLFLLCSRLNKTIKSKKLFSGTYCRNSTRLGSSRNDDRLEGLENGLELDNPSCYADFSDCGGLKSRANKESTALYNIALTGLTAPDGGTSGSRGPEVRKLASFTGCQVIPLRYERRVRRKSRKNSRDQIRSNSASLEVLGARNVGGSINECRRIGRQAGSYLSFEAGQRSGSYPTCLAEGVMPKVPLPPSATYSAAVVLGNEPQAHEDPNIIVLQTTNAAGCYTNQKFRLTPVLEASCINAASPRCSSRTVNVPGGYQGTSMVANFDGAADLERGCNSRQGYHCH